MNLFDLQWRPETLSKSVFHNRHTGRAKPPWMQSKTALRAQVQSALRSLAAEDILGQSTAVAEQLFGCEPVARCLRQPGGLVCSYLPMRRELSPDAITQQLLAAGQGVMVPRVTGGASADMVMLPVSSWADVAAFPKNQWGIPEPPLPAAGGSEPLATDLLAQVKLVLVPGLAFDSGCARLGRGKVIRRHTRPRLHVR